MSSCLPWRKRKRDSDRAPLLPQYQDDTEREAVLHQKLHTYQMLRALSKGYMPSNEQTIVNLRTLLGSDVLNPAEAGLSDSGRLLVKNTKQWLRQFIDLLGAKNSEDQLQDFLWLVTQSRVSVDVSDLQDQARQLKGKAKATAATQSLKTIGSLLLTNSDFRLLIADLQTIGRDVFRDTAMTASKVAEDVGNQVARPRTPRTPRSPSQRAIAKSPVKSPVGSPLKQISSPMLVPSKRELIEDAQDFSSKVAESAVVVGKEAEQSAEEHFSGEEKQLLIARLKRAVSKLRQRPDYSQSVNYMADFLKNWALAYSRALDVTLDSAARDVEANYEMREAAESFWKLLTSFGNPQEWEALQDLLRKLFERHHASPDFEAFVGEATATAQRALMDPGFFEEGNRPFNRLREKGRQLGNEESMRSEMDALMEQAQRTLQAVWNDKQVVPLLNTTRQLGSILSPAHSMVNSELLYDLMHTFTPLMIAAVQHIPIPRLEVSTPALDLLLENVIIEPGETVNATSFFPFRFRAESYNAVEIRKPYARTLESIGGSSSTPMTTSRTTSLVSLKVEGLSLRAQDIGYKLDLQPRRDKTMFPWLGAISDSGFVSFALDRRGIDIQLDIEIARDAHGLERALSLRSARVRIHRLDLHLHPGTKFRRLLTTLLRPLICAALRQVLERQLARALADTIRTANRELIFARERLRATRIADPADLSTFVRAVAARLAPEPDPDVYVRLGVLPPDPGEPGFDHFGGVFAPGSLARLWEMGGRRAGERVDEMARPYRDEVDEEQDRLAAPWTRAGWRSAVFDVPVASPN